MNFSGSEFHTRHSVPPKQSVCSTNGSGQAVVALMSVIQAVVRLSVKPTLLGRQNWDEA